MIHRKLLITIAIMAAVVTTACSDATAPKQLVPGTVAATALAPSFSATFPRSGALHITKECSQYTRLAGGFCTITSSNLDGIEVGTKVIYAVASGATVLNSDVVLAPPGPGNNKAFGHVVLDLASGQAAEVGACPGDDLRRLLDPFGRVLRVADRDAWRRARRHRRLPRGSRLVGPIDPAT